MATHDEPTGSSLSDLDLRVRALETVLTQKNYVTSEALDAIVEAHETRIGPHIGARAVARAWVDPEYREALLADATTAVAEFADDGHVGELLIAVENTPRVHNVVVCTLCSCYPWDVLGLPPNWYKSFAYRSRTVKQPRAVLSEFGLRLDPDVDVRVWDSTAETRYLVVPMRPAGTDGFDEERLAALVDRDCMIGVRVPAPADGAR
ncbi:nitrile hydratase subunit alpha [Mycolicibacterium sp. P1-18]|uniref:nitrile hydratase subunit alpha n=1 Tax=Mycolicibacterium sp. P1-18 TaxID=2024615 RepID=UPI001F5B97D2|nr:nitrile hydratase subunit alpha [Mycolicibacterium sp. P1-18]